MPVGEWQTVSLQTRSDFMSSKCVRMMDHRGCLKMPMILQTIQCNEI